MIGGCFVPCAKRVWLQSQSPVIVIPLKELKEWQAKFGALQTKPLSGERGLGRSLDRSLDRGGEGCAVTLAGVGPCAWGSLSCHCMIDSSTPELDGPRTPDEHGPSSRRTWALFADQAIVYKSVQHKGRVTTELSWYGHGGYDPSRPGISAKERARVEYDPEFPDIELL